MQHPDRLEAALAQARERRNLPPPIERRLLRMRAGLTQSALAASLGITTAAISRYESGDRTPRAEILASYATALARLAKEGA
jgi:predicted transcriptional regulator